MKRVTEKFRTLPPERQRWLIAGAFMLAQAFIWLVLFRNAWYGDKSITDVPIYYSYASRIARGMLPYRDFASEYPPVAMLLFSLPRIFSGLGYPAFNTWFEAEMFLFSCGDVALLTVAAWKQWRSLRKLAGALGAYTLFILAMGSIVESRFDLAASFVILASLVCFITDRYVWAWLLLGVGLMTKVVPVLIGPFYFVIHLRRRQFTDLWLGPASLLFAAAIIGVPLLLAAPAGLAGAFLYHFERPLQLESSWSSPLLLASRFGNYPLRILSSYGSHNVFASLSTTFASLTMPVTLLLLFLVYLFFIHRSRDDPQEGAGLLFRFALLAIGVFIFAGKVFSPQFLIWLLPLAVLVKGPDRRRVLLLFGAILLLTQIEFPFNYWRLYSLNAAIVIEVAFRNALLGAFLLLVTVRRGLSGGKSGSDLQPPD